jgi:hypothetical protein
MEFVQKDEDGEAESAVRPSPRVVRFGGVATNRRGSERLAARD